MNATPKTKSLRVLVLEDDSVAAQVEIFELHRAGFASEWQRVETLAEFEAALAPPPDLILADFELPTCNGLQALERLRQRQLNIPFIIVTGVLDDAMAARCIGLGASDCLLKDRLARLGPAVTHALEERFLRAEAAREERVMQLSEARYRRLFETAPDGILLLTSRDGRIVDVNPFLLRLLGHTRAELLGRRLWDIPAFRHLACSEAAFATLQAQDDIHHDCLPLVARDGRECPAEFVANACLLEGHRIIQCYFPDISRRTGAEQALARAEGRCRVLRQATGQLVWNTDAAGNVTGDLPEWRAFTGQSVAEIQGTGWSAALHPDDRARTLEAWRHALEQRAPCDTKYRLRRHDGEYRLMQSRGMPVFEGDHIIREWIGVSLDITERRQA